MPYYAVAKGHMPGIYSTWNQCWNQIYGFSGSDFRKRFCHADAKRYMQRRRVQNYYDCGIDPNDSYDPYNFYYAVAVGWTPGIYASWWECIRETRYYRRAEYRKFCCYEDAENFMMRYGVNYYYDAFADDYYYDDDDDDYYISEDSDSDYYLDDEDLNESDYWGHLPGGFYFYF